MMMRQSHRFGDGTTHETRSRQTSSEMVGTTAGNHAQLAKHDWCGTFLLDENPPTKQFRKDSTVKLWEAKWKFVAISTGIILLATFNGYGQPPVNRPAAPSSRIFLHKGWAIQSSAIVKESGDALSGNSFRPAAKWYRARVPSTVVAALIENKVYPD